MQFKRKNQVYFKSLFQNLIKKKTIQKKEKKVILANQKKGKKSTNKKSKKNKKFYPIINYYFSFSQIPIQVH